MNIRLSPTQEKWLEAQVASGALPSVEDGVRAAISDLMTIAEDDLAWAKPLVDEARRSVADGRSTDGAEFLAKLDQRIGALKGE